MAFDSCDREARARGFCGLHYQRNRTHGDPTTLLRPGRPKGSGRARRGKYIRLNLGNRMIAEHRYMMERHLGRRLRPFENVHHINGITTDNRLENLELWAKPQPAGQRVEDLVAWVAKNYPDEVAEKLRKQP